MQKLNEEIKQKFLLEFGRNVRKIRKHKKLSQYDLAFRINGDEMKISRIERGLYNFGISSLLILAKALEVEVIELFKIEDIKFLQNNIWE